MKKVHFLFMLVLFIVLTIVSINAESKVLSTGLVPTPEVLQKSFRSTRVKAGQTGIPAAVDLSPLFPEPGFQGNIGSCTAWATAYACKSFQENLERGWGTAEKSSIFSPSYVYNQINKGMDRGSALEDAAALLQSKGCATFETMPYTTDYKKQPSSASHGEAANFKARGFAKVDFNNVNAVKTVIAEGNCVLIGMMVYQNFMDYTGGVYSRVSGALAGGHAMCLLGYDESKKAFKGINSWGTWWGEGGYFWISYDLLPKINMTAVVIYDEVINQPSKSRAPIEVTASQGSSEDTIKVSWQEVQNADYYKIYRTEEAGGDFRSAGETRGTTLIDNDLKAGMEYYYSVKSVGAGGESDFSEITRGWTIETEVEFGIPRNLKAQFAGKTIKLRWDRVETSDGYFVYRWDKDQEQFLRIGMTADEGYLDRDIIVSPHFERYIVSAYKGKYEGQACEMVTVSVEAAPDIFGAPQEVKASEGTFRDRVEISWQKVPQATKYVVQKWSDERPYWLSVGRTSGTAIKDWDIQEKSAYYSVTAYKSGMESLRSEYVIGYVSGYSHRKIETERLDDRDYYHDYNKPEKEFFSDESFFSDDSFFDDPDTFFDNFSEEDFFYFDEEAFFYIDEEKFFGNTEGYFD
jgi:fibronectin type 3 domain-containing protein